MKFISTQAAEKLADAVTPEPEPEPVVDNPPVEEEEKCVVVGYGKEDDNCLLAGIEMLDEKEVEGIAMVLTHPAVRELRSTRSVVITQDELMLDGKDKVALASYPCRAIVLSLENLWQRVCRECREEEAVSLRAAWQYELLVTVGHELCHIDTAADEEPISEEDADLIGRQILWEIAKKYDVEPSHGAATTSFFNKKMLGLLYGEEGEQGDWADRQRLMLENGLSYFREKDDEWKELKITSFKTFCQVNADDRDDESWSAAPVPGDGWSKILRVMDPVENVTPAPNVASMGDGNPDLGEEATFYASIDAEMNQAVAAYNMEAGIPPANTTPLSVPSPTPAVGLQTVETGVATPATVPQTPANSFIPTTGPGAPPVPAGGVGQLPNMGGLDLVGVPVEAAMPIIEGLYAKIYNHIFATCGRQLNHDVGFANPEMVYQPIELTPEERKVLVSYKTHVDRDPNTGQLIDVMVTANTPGMQGHISKNAKLPMYNLVFECDAVNQLGQMQRVLVKRAIVPQNVNAVAKGGAGLSQPAMNARAGSCILYVFEDERALKVSGKDMKYRNIDGNIWKPGA